jgi:hypothetical protein
LIPSRKHYWLFRVSYQRAWRKKALRRIRSTRLVSAQTQWHATHFLFRFHNRCNAYSTHQCGRLRYFWYLGPLQAGPTLRSVPDYDTTRPRVPTSLASCYDILAGRREDEFRVMRDLLREEIPLRLLGLLRYSTVGSCSSPGSLMCPLSTSPSSQFCCLAHVHWHGGYRFQQWQYEEHPIDRKRC